MSNHSACQISVIIPAYNEAGFIADTIHTLAGYLRDRMDTFEIIVVDDGSSDGTVDVLKRITADSNGKNPLVVLANEKNSGKGFSIRRGVLSSRGEVIVFMDADLAYDLQAVDRITSAVRDGAQLAIGSRLVPGAEILSGVPMVRSFTGRAFNLLVQLLLFRGIPDTQCGIKGFARQSALDIFSLQTVRTFGFDVELLYIARLHGYRIDQVPVRLVNYRNESRVHVMRDSWRMLRDVIKVRWQGMRGRYTVKA